MALGNLDRRLEITATLRYGGDALIERHILTPQLDAQCAAYAVHSDTPHGLACRSVAPLTRQGVDDPVGLALRFLEVTSLQGRTVEDRKRRKKSMQGGTATLVRRGVPQVLLQMRH